MLSGRFFFFSFLFAILLHIRYMIYNANPSVGSFWKDVLNKYLIISSEGTNQ